MQAAVHSIVSLLLVLGLSVNVSAQTRIESDRVHDIFTEVLGAHVNNGLVDYAGIKEDPRFDVYLHTLEQARPGTLATEAEKLAFWINAYNALAVKGILDGLSPSSFFGRIRYFKTTDYEVGGRSINLYDIERKIIMPFNEVRIHFAIVCASLSCPKLRSEAYLASSLQQQLHDNAVDFINDEQKNRFDATGKRAWLSRIFDWFDKDFEKQAGSVQAYVASFVQHETHKQALLKQSYRIKHLKYDWKLNGTPAD